MRYLIIFLLAAVIGSESYAQGCVAIRSNGSTCTLHEPGHDNAGTGWLLGLNNRYFKSFRHYRDREEEKQRIAEGTEVINHSYVLDIGLTRVLNDRWSVAVFVPVANNRRTSLYEHTGTSRHETSSFGLGDVRIAAYRWVLDPAKFMKGNIQAGLGIKLPTGDYRYMDYFQKTDSTRVLGPVDQSIQLGDGGTGISLELNAFKHLTRAATLYANAYYLANPREHNGVSTARGGTASPTAVRYGSDVMSVPDQYMVRGGVSYGIKQFTLSAGMRMECVPSEDLIGGSNGFRRPGYVIAAEPVVAYKAKKAQFYLSVPYAVERRRTQSVPDRIRSELTKTRFVGDAAFADYSINFGASFSLK